MNANTYQIKQYRAWSYIKTINPDIVRSNISFTAHKNGGQWQMTLELSEKFNINNYKFNDIIQVYVFNKNNKSWKLLYTWFIQKIRQRATVSEIIEISCIWVVWLLQNIFYRNGDLVVNKNDTPMNILSDILTVFNWLSDVDITLWDTLTTPDNIHLDFDHKTCFEAIQEVMRFVDGYWYIDQYKKLNIRQQETKHKLTYKKDIQSLEIVEDVDIYNRLRLYYSWADKEYNDLTSQWLYGMREKRVEDTTIKNVATADQYAVQYFEKNAYPKKKTRIVVTDQYDSWTWSTEYIEPWDWVRVNNFYEVLTGWIEKMTYSNGFVSLELERSDNFIELIKQ